MRTRLAPRRVVRIGSVYAGIAGLELGILAALLEAGIPARVEWQVEIDGFCSRVLARHFPDAKRYGDVATVGSANLAPVDVLCGGFMCTDVSSAGKGKGLGRETRSGHTWHHLLRLVRELDPRWLVVENVASGARRWVPEVVRELRATGRRPRAVPLRALDVGAPHRRARVFLVADRVDGDGCERLPEREQSRRVASGAPWGGARPAAAEDRGVGPVADSHVDGREGERGGGVLDGEREARGDDPRRRGREVSRGVAQGDSDESGLEGRGVRERRRADEGTPRPSGREGTGGVGLADASRAGQQRAEDGAECGGVPDARREREIRGVGQADSERPELREQPRGIGGASGAREGEPRNDGPPGVGQADSSISRREGADRLSRSGGSGREAVVAQRLGDAGCDGRAPEPRVGACSARLPFDVAGHTFPAGRGEAQHAWEPPRALPKDVKISERPAKLKACGNAVVPQCGLVAGRVLVAVMRGAA